ncbi:MAG: hypothetical protein VKL39_24870, partial [Leptolyngbyaceae bacterium]|nr:hypothetical protein [Leptolyngbyaceae bacterium]
RQVSVEGWMVVLAAWVTWRITGRLGAVAPTLPDTLLPALRPRRGHVAAGIDPRPRDLVLLEGLVLGGTDSERAADLRLRPRLRRLARHVLRNQHGIDLDREPERAAAAVGASWWLLDPTVEGRTPELDELEALVTALEGGQP